MAKPRPASPASVPAPIEVLRQDYPNHHRIAPHTHPAAQLLYAVGGLMRLTAPRGRWLVPTLRAVWIPAGVEHAVQMVGPVAMRSLYFRPDQVPGMPDRCTVLKVRPFFRALITEATEGRFRPRAGPRWRWLTALILEELRAAAVEPLFVPLPEDERLARVCAALLNSPGSDWTLERWAGIAGASPRTLARLFHARLGMSFGAWRDQVRLAEAVARLGAAVPVGLVAARLGYRSASAFAAMFKRNLGCSPGAYLGGG